MTQEHARPFAKLFGLDPASVTPVALRENQTFAAEKDGQKYALRLHRPGYTPTTEILSEMQWLEYLASKDFGVPAPLLSVNGRLIEEVNGQVASALCWMPGVTMHEALEDNRTERPDLFFKLGETLAQLHNVSDQWTLPKDFSRRCWDSDGLLGDAPIWGRFWENPFLSDKDRARLIELREHATSTLKNVESPFDFGLIHADALSENVLIHNDQPALIDFDDSGFGYRLFDLATALNRHRSAPDYSDIKAALFDGYKRHRPLDTTHFDLIMILRACTYLGWIVARIDEPGGHARLERMRASLFSLL